MSGGGGGGGLNPIASIQGSILGMAADRAEYKAQKKAYDTNAAWLEEQAEHARQATNRELLIHERETNEIYGNQVSGVAKGGLDMSGSPLLLLANTRMREFEEARAIKEQGYLQVREASLKAQEQRDMAAYARSAYSLKKTAGWLNIANAGMSLGTMGSNSQQGGKK